MHPRDILAANVRAIKEKHGLSNLKLAKKAGVANGTIGRIVLAQGDADIDTIACIAKVFHIEPWQLLVPNLDTGNPPHITNATPEETALYERLKAVLKTVA